jgi:hypothetical protein
MVARWIFSILISSLSFFVVVTYRVAVTAAAGFQGAQPRALQCAVVANPAPKWGGRQRGWLRARAVPGAGTNRHRLTGWGLAVAAQPWGLSPRSAGGLSTGTKFRPCGRSNGQESNLLQTSCEVALPMSYQWWHAWSRTRHVLSEWSPRPCRYPAFAMCGMQNINRTRRLRMPGTGGANVSPNPGLSAVTVCAGCSIYCQMHARWLVWV